MARQRPFMFPLLALVSGVLLACACAPAFGQRSSVTRGAMVRVSRPDSVGQPVWSTKRVFNLSSDRLLLAETDRDPLVRLNEAIRLEVRRSHTKSLLGGLFGLGFGSFAGWGVRRSVGGQGDATAESIAGALVGGVAGAGIGALIGKRVRSAGWEAVPSPHTIVPQQRPHQLDVLARIPPVRSRPSSGTCTNTWRRTIRPAPCRRCVACGLGGFVFADSGSERT